MTPMRETPDRLRRTHRMGRMAWWLIGILALVPLTVAGPAPAATPAPVAVEAKGVGMITTYAGQVRVSRAVKAGQAAPVTLVPVKVGQAVFPYDVIETQAKSRAQILFQDDSILNVAEKTRLEITEAIYDPVQGSRQSVMKLQEGKVRAIISRFLTGGQSKFEIHTPTTVAAARGTEVIVHHIIPPVLTEPPRTILVLISGILLAQSMAQDQVVGAVTMTPGTRVEVMPGAPPPLPTPVPPNELRQLLRDTTIVRAEAKEEAEKKAAEAQAKAEEAKKKAADAQAKADETKKKAEEAKAKAEEAQKKEAETKAKEEEAKAKTEKEKGDVAKAQAELDKKTEEAKKAEAETKKAEAEAAAVNKADPKARAAMLNAMLAREAKEAGAAKTEAEAAKARTEQARVGGASPEALGRMEAEAAAKTAAAVRAEAGVRAAEADVAAGRAGNLMAQRQTMFNMMGGEIEQARTHLAVEMRQATDAETFHTAIKQEMVTIQQEVMTFRQDMVLAQTEMQQVGQFVTAAVMEAFVATFHAEIMAGGATMGEVALPGDRPMMPPPGMMPPGALPPGMMPPPGMLPGEMLVMPGMLPGAFDYTAALRTVTDTFTTGLINPTNLLVTTTALTTVPTTGTTGTTVEFRFPQPANVNVIAAFP